MALATLPTVAPGRDASPSRSRRRGSASIRNQPRSVPRLNLDVHPERLDEEDLAEAARDRAPAQRRDGELLEERVDGRREGAWNRPRARADQPGEGGEQRMSERRLEVNAGRQHLGRVRLGGRPEPPAYPPVHDEQLAIVQTVAPEGHVDVDHAGPTEHDVQRHRLDREDPTPGPRTRRIEHEDASKLQLLERRCERVVPRVHEVARSKKRAHLFEVPADRFGKHFGTVPRGRGRRGRWGVPFGFPKRVCEPAACVLASDGPSRHPRARTIPAS